MSQVRAVLRQVTVFTGVALETSVLPRDVMAACCVAALGAVLLGTARHGANTASPTAAQRVFGRELFSGRCLERSCATNNGLTCDTIYRYIYERSYLRNFYLFPFFLYYC
jgi:hypothetical protein